MAKRMKRTTNFSNTETDAQLLEITEEVALGKLCTLQRGKNPRELVLGQVPVKHLAKLNAHWYEAMLIALSFDPKREVFKIHITAKQADKLLYPKSRVNRRKDKGVKATFTTPDGLPVYYPLDLLRSEVASILSSSFSQDSLNRSLTISSE